MPTYGYQCTRCENDFEVFQRITDDPLKSCDACGGDLQKKIFPVGIVFKGSGFYVNDYASKGKATDVPTDTSAPVAKAAETAAPAATETKSEPATPAVPAKAESASTPAPTAGSPA